MIDLHTHTFASDGDLCPAELVRRAEAAGLAAIAITDHADASNLERLVREVVVFVRETQPYCRIRLIAGVELTHVPPGQVAELARRARRLGAALVVLHGETVSEPVAPGTNRAAIEAGVDILAHPGLITPEEAHLAASKGVLLEVSTRPSHGMANGHVVAAARAAGAGLVIDSDTHAPSDIMEAGWRRRVALGAGLADADIDRIDRAMAALVERLAPSLRVT
ncbi:MAG: histidinol phosphate phosphatase domain-containing protein [Spirochaetes bacterium]|nr:histidinol phosphate phosphatase domain-containing protein [Spirochaetota bacterium]